MENVIAFVVVVAILIAVSVFWNLFMDNASKKRSLAEERCDFSVKQLRQGIRIMDKSLFAPVMVFGDKNTDVEFSEAVTNIQVTDLPRIL